MASRQLSAVLAHLRQSGAGRTDGELLEAFVARRDEAAFEELVRRHGPMVLGVCRRALGNEADAEDAFQATFLVLARKAGSVRPRGMVGNWLYGVAHNTARSARATKLRRQQKEREAGTMSGKAAPEEVWAELQALLDQELPALPDTYRAVIVLCDLEGKTVKEAARQLGWPQGTAASRLTRGRALLARRLARHGTALSGGALAAALARGPALASVPPPLVVSTVQAAASVAAGQAAAGAVSSAVAALSGAVVKSLLLTKLKAMTAVLLAALALGGGGLLAYRALRAAPAPGTASQPLAGGRADSKARAAESAPRSRPPAEGAGRRHEAWRLASKVLRLDPSLVVYYTFEPEGARDRTLRDQAGDRARPHDGAITGCSWVEGRWPGKRALELKPAGDRVRLRVPGWFESITLIAWVRVDALPNVNHALFMADGWRPGGLHWQIGEGGKLVLDVKAPSVKGGASSSHSVSAEASATMTAKRPQLETFLAVAKTKYVRGEKSPPARPDGHYHAHGVFGPRRLGRWTQLAVVYDRDRRLVTHYVDGQPVARLPTLFDVPLCIENAQLGNWHAAGHESPAPVRCFDGRMDELLLFSRPLGDGEIGQLYAEGRPPS